MAGGGGSSDGEPEFQVAPMVDVLLTILVFFMMITSAQVLKVDKTITLPVAPDALKRDSQWGTTTMRPRLLSWTRRFAAAAAATGTFPRLRMLAEGLNDQLGSRWPDTVIPAYPALAEPGSTVAELPDGWESDN